MRLQSDASITLEIEDMFRLLSGSGVDKKDLDFKTGTFTIFRRGRTIESRRQEKEYRNWKKLDFEYIQRQQEYQREYVQRPGVRTRQRLALRRWKDRVKDDVEVKAKQTEYAKAYYQRPEVKEHRKLQGAIYMREYRMRQKLRKLGEL